MYFLRAVPPLLFLLVVSVFVTAADSVSSFILSFLIGSVTMIAAFSRYFRWLEGEEKPDGPIPPATGPGLPPGGPGDYADRFTGD